MSRLILLVGFLVTILPNSVSAAVCPSSSSAESTGANNGTSCTVSGTASTIKLNFISGFTDNTIVSAEGGNNGTTVGAQRKLSFIKAAEIVAAEIESNVVVEVDAQFAGLTCSTNQATLGSAGATSNSGYGSPAPGGLRDNTFYPIGLMNAILGSDQDPSISDITAQFNSNIGTTNCLENSNGWYYGFDAPPSNYIGFVTVLLHEMTHGFGFASLVNKSTGAKANASFDDIYSVYLFDDVTGRSWMDPSQSDADRAASAISGNRLLWDGTNVNTNAVAYTSTGFADKDGSGTFTSGDLIQMYAPNPVEGGSSVSHFDTAVSPNELMEPQYTEGTLSLGLAKFLLQDIGWSVSINNTAPTITAVDQTTNEDVAITGLDASGWGSDVDGDTLTYSITSCPSNVTCDINDDGTGLTLTPAQNYYANTNSVTITVTDGQGGSASDNFNLTINPVNDDPTWSNISDQSIVVGNTLSITLTNYASDVEDDTLSFSINQCGAALSCNITSNTLDITANSSSASAQTVEVIADDGNSGTANVSFAITIEDNPSITVNGVQLNPNDTGSMASTNVSIDISNLNNNYNYALSLNGMNLNSLLGVSPSLLQIGLPSSGQFAGTYTLTLTNKSSGASYDIYLERDPVISLSASSLLEGTNTQTLTVIGAAANDVFNLVSSEQALSFKDINGAVISDVTIQNDADTNNATSVHLDVGTLSSITPVNIQVDSGLNINATMFPSRPHSIQINNDQGNAITDATLTLETSALTSFNIESVYQSNDSGSITVTLPDDSTDYSASISASGYQTQSIDLQSSVLQQTVLLQTGGTLLSIRGHIEATGSLNFATDIPELTLILSDGSEVSATVNEVSDNKSSFDYSFNNALGELESLRFSHPDAETLTIQFIEGSNYLVFLQSKRASDDTITVIGSSGGGSLSWLLVFVIASLVTPRFNTKR
ncbi:hypothetical protein HF888_05200 [Bermanella marisrubri]|uniref:Protease-associated PA n=1 Tax=Bermanella marisrubri TaxID=207949 RepID=Q1N1V0_9GAMM|nr:cadherin-like domain-containing protein [Bermanella marisrubri]EAT12181.1 Protease-associated PA [Oceanobacter sp. RED65] [Bermanella marisrubri]QIZ83655.1 hypothetical protein HF888_05200 [Bermanella marisrubri]